MQGHSGKARTMGSRAAAQQACRNPGERPFAGLCFVSRHPCAFGRREWRAGRTHSSSRSARRRDHTRGHSRARSPAATWFHPASRRTVLPIRGLRPRPGPCRAPRTAGQSLVGIRGRSAWRREHQRRPLAGRRPASAHPAHRPARARGLAVADPRHDHRNTPRCRRSPARAPRPHPHAPEQADARRRADHHEPAHRVGDFCPGGRPLAGYRAYRTRR
ncbi:hypothetical protein B7C42_06044 [Nocardia cerradoensis]|uniref:Uncharacterized protein n=1 Tax=Nocardia cerradoensis TaxID=85688 RepID=A0A231GYP9_9NOCA|nr:hypothetical protein B7C42_06044 [Nocardia cerradoensis]